MPHSINIIYTHHSLSSQIITQSELIILRWFKHLIIVNQFLTLFNISYRPKLHTRHVCGGYINIFVDVGIVKIGITITYAETESYITHFLNVLRPCPELKKVLSLSALSLSSSANTYRKYSKGRQLTIPKHHSP